MRLVFHESLNLSELLDALLPEMRDNFLTLDSSEQAKLTSIEYNPGTGKVKIRAYGHIDERILRILSRYLKREVIVENTAPLSEKILNAWSEIKERINGSVPYFTSLARPRVEDDRLIITVSSEFHKNLFQKRVKHIKEVVEEFAGTGIEIEFEVNEQEVDFSPTPEESLEDTSTDLGHEEKRPEIRSVDGVILGSRIRSKPVTVSQAQLKSGEKVCIAGEVFYVEHRVIGSRGFQKLVFYMTDKRDSLTCVLKGDHAEKVNGQLSKGTNVIVEGEVSYDEYLKEPVVEPSKINLYTPEKRTDTAPVKRVELHAHTKMSAMDGVMDVAQLVERAAEWSHDAIAVTDHGVVQAIPEFYNVAKKHGIKPIFGMEAYLVDDIAPFVKAEKTDAKLSDLTFVAFDFETTGLDPRRDEIVEIGAVKIKGSQVIGEFHTLVKPRRGMSRKSMEITGISSEMLENAPAIEEVLPKFLDFIADSVLVAHNAKFDYSFLRVAIRNVMGEERDFSYIDTLGMAKALLDIKGYSLDKVAKELKITDFKHHRALDDARAVAQIFTKLVSRARRRGVETLGDLGRLKADIDYRRVKPYHATILVVNRKGLKNLYKIVTLSHVQYFHGKPRVPKSILAAHREGLLIGSACLSGELLSNYLDGETEEELMERAKEYDFIEIMPLDVISGEEEKSEKSINRERLIEAYRKLYRIGKRLNIPVVMTSDVHFLDPEDAKVRAVLMSGREDMLNQPAAYFRTTDEMMKAALEIFDDETIAEEIVVTSPRMIAEMIEEIVPLEGKLHPPLVEGVDEEIERITWKKAKERYGDPLPDLVEKRIKRELEAIIGHGYAVLYYIAMKLVENSLANGYVVGSRGSVGSSLVATMLGITEVNPLPPHYVCPRCTHTEFVTDGSADCGYDLPEKICPVCGEKMDKDGHDIPFETFMGFEGDKVPDIDLNFSGEFQSAAHRYIEELFGSDHVFRAGTISTIAERSAYGFVKKFAERLGKGIRRAEMERLVRAVTGVKRTTGQHPGGLMIIPKDRDVHDFTPVQYPANDSSAGVLTTHFAYEYIHDDLVKIDALGHDDPTMIKLLKDLTGIDPMGIPMDDPDTLKLFSSVEPLKLKRNRLRLKVGTLGIPEFGTQFVRGMLEETNPQSFADLVRISGLSHGTDVWNNNARDWIASKVATLREVIACRDDIMNDLIHEGMEPKEAFKIMESVRKGKGLTEEQEKKMRELGVPNWFIESCKRIKYLFPKAHATAYVSMAFRIAYFKVHHPLAFYCAYFTVKGDEFDPAVILKGPDAIEEELRRMREEGIKNVKDRNRETILEIALEAYDRGIEFLPVDLWKSDAYRFLIENGRLRIPFSKLPGLGVKAAESIVAAREEKPFISLEDLAARARINRTQIEILQEFGVLKGLPETSQFTLF